MKKVALLYGGTSAEHEVSIMSAKNVRAMLEAADFTVVPIFITKEGEWQLAEGSLKGRELIVALPDICDVAFPLTHGTYGEDGGLQGLLELLQVPYVGCDVVSSAGCFDKEYTKRILRDNDIAVVDFLGAESANDYDYNEVKQLGEVVFVKPVRQGSSVGVSRATNEQELRAALELAFKHDNKALIERAVNGREIEFSVLEEDGHYTVSLPGEIIVREGFYDYETKYENDDAELIIPAKLDPDAMIKGAEIAGNAFRALSCRGMARVDCFYESGKWIVNELNTLPGFTNISMYPKLLEASGISQTELVKRLIAAASRED